MSRASIRNTSQCTLLLLGLLLSGAAAAALDPTQPPVNLNATGAEAGEQAKPLVLQAVLRGAGTTRAVINGQSLQVGAELAGARIMAIYLHAVLIERNGQQELLRLVEPITTPSR